MIANAGRAGRRRRRDRPGQLLRRGGDARRACDPCSPAATRPRAVATASAALPQGLRRRAGRRAASPATRPTRSRGPRSSGLHPVRDVRIDEAGAGPLGPAPALDAGVGGRRHRAQRGRAGGRADADDRSRCSPIPPARSCCSTWCRCPSAGWPTPTPVAAAPRVPRPAPRRRRHRPGRVRRRWRGVRRAGRRRLGSARLTRSTRPARAPRRARSIRRATASGSDVTADRSSRWHRPSSSRNSALTVASGSGSSAGSTLRSASAQASCHDASSVASFGSRLLARWSSASSRRVWASSGRR